MDVLHGAYCAKGTDIRSHVYTTPLVQFWFLFLWVFFVPCLQGQFLSDAWDTRPIHFTHKTSSMTQFPSHVQGRSSVAVAVLRDPFLLEHFFAFGDEYIKQPLLFVPKPVC